MENLDPLENLENLTAENLTASHGKFNANLSGKFVKKHLHYQDGCGIIHLTTNTTLIQGVESHDDRQNGKQD